MSELILTLYPLFSLKMKLIFIRRYAKSMKMISLYNKFISENTHRIDCRCTGKCRWIPGIENQPPLYYPHIK